MVQPDWHPETLDYERLIKVAERASPIEDPRTEIGKHINADLVLKAAARRVEDVAEADRKEAPAYRDLVHLLANTWSEAFVLGVIFLKSQTGKMPEEWKREFIMGIGSKGSDAMAEAFGGAIDHMRLVDAEKLMQQWNHAGQSRISAESQKAVDVTTMSFTAVKRVQYAIKYHKVTGPVPHSKVNELGFSVFVDGFLRGLLFEELGGHRED